MIALIVISFFVAAFSVQVFMRRARRHARSYGADMPQRFHKGHVPRLGGAGILVGMGVAWLAAGITGTDPFNVSWPVQTSMLTLLCILPAVLGGIVEDVTQRVKVRYRLGLTIGSALLVCWLLGLGVSRTGFETVDGWLVAIPFATVLFAALAIGGLPHAFNIIDGYNGLAGTVAVLVCLAISHVALQVGDRQLAAMVVCLVGATFGFLVWNYPRGKIFAGDGGAYVWGMVIAVAVRHAGAAAPRGVALVPDAAADLPGVGNAVFHLPQAGARAVARHGRRAALPPADLPAHRARGLRDDEARRC